MFRVVFWKTRNRALWATTGGQNEPIFYTENSDSGILSQCCFHFYCRYYSILMLPVIFLCIFSHLTRKMVNKYKRKTQPISQEQFTKTLDILRSTDISIREAARKNREISFFFIILCWFVRNCRFLFKNMQLQHFFLLKYVHFAHGSFYTPPGSKCPVGV